MTPTSFDAVARRLALALPESRAVEGDGSLELSTPSTQPTRLISATVVEGSELRAIPVNGPPAIGFAAFLDGTQQSRVARYWRGGVPIVHGTVAAVIRERRDKRMGTWSHVVRHRLYASRANLPEAVWNRLSDAGLEVSDTSEHDAGDGVEHPLALRESAIHRVQRDREDAERELALAWFAREDRPLLIDGGISGSDVVARAPGAVGVIKSHRTLYASGEALATILALEPAERSSVFLVTSPKRTTVASWYLRIRDPRGREPMWGLVRVEVAALGPDDQRADGITERADAVSRWILAESAPVALPDSRWDKMVYGVRDCEEFLRAVM